MKSTCNPFEHSSFYSRRDFMSVILQGSLAAGLAAKGTSVLAGEAPKPAQDVKNLPGFGAAKHVIYVMLSGGFSQLDSFNIIPDARDEVRGETKPLPTNVDGIQMGHWFPRLAQHMDKIAIVNSRISRIGAHAKGQYYVRTAYERRGADTHPHLGAWMDKLLDPLSDQLPSNFLVNAPSYHPNNGWLHPKHAPLPITDPEKGLQNSKRYPGVTDERLLKRFSMSKTLGERFRNKYLNDEVQTVAPLYDDALTMMRSEDLAAFDLSQEDSWKHEAYGENRLGQGLLLARRLVERGVRHVEVNYGGWDNHNAIYSERTFPEKSRHVDQAMASLLEDLDKSGLLKDTLVVLTSEFGRTPEVNQNLGRDHWPKSFSCLLAGAGVKTGQVYGKTDKEGVEILENKIDTPDWCATIAHIVGLPWNETFFSPSGRPFKPGGKRGQAHVGLLA